MSKICKICKYRYKTECTLQCGRKTKDISIEECTLKEDKKNELSIKAGTNADRDDDREKRHTEGR